MLPQREIVAWRTHAPWATDVQVEQDLLITRAMLAIFRDPFLSTQVAMRGGTMLHKIHVVAAARYSEDIDLVAVGTRPGNHIRLALIRVPSPILGGGPRTDVTAQVKLAIRNTIRPSRLLVLEWVYVPRAILYRRRLGRAPPRSPYASPRCGLTAAQRSGRRRGRLSAI